MRSFHQFIGISTGVCISLLQVTPAISQSNQGQDGSLEERHQPVASSSELNPSSKKESSEEELSGKSEKTTVESPKLVKPSDAEMSASPQPTVEPASKPQDTSAQTPESSQPDAVQTQSDRSKPASKPVPLAKPTNLADFKKAQTEPVPAPTPASPVPSVPGSETPPIDPTIPTPRIPDNQTSPLSPIIPTLPGIPGSEAPPTSPAFGPPPALNQVPTIQNRDGVIQAKPIGPAKPGRSPEYLFPNPNPLTIPTRPEDVRLRGVQPITLLQAVELAKRSNRDLQVSTLQLERSRAALREAQAALYPTIGAQANLAQSQSAQGQLQEEATNQLQAALPRSQRGLRGGDGRSSIDSANLALSGTVQVSYDIYTSGRRPAQIRAAEQQVRSDQLQVEVTEQQIRLDVANAYYNLQEADEAVRIQAFAVRNAEASLRDTIALERAGLGTRFDVLRAQVQLANTQQNVTNAVSNQRIRRRELAQILAIPGYIDLAAADPVEIGGSWTLTLPQTIVLALKNRAELEQFLAQRELAEQQRRVAISGTRPNVNLQVSYNILNNLRDTLGFGTGYTVAAGLQWNFFDGGAARAQANQQEANIAIAETRFAQTREQIQLQVESAFSNLQSTFLNIGTNRQAVAQAREALRLARLRFQAGVGTQTEVINAENDLTLAEGNLVTAIIGYNRSLASLQRSVTNLPIPTGSTTPSIPGPAPVLPPEPTLFPR